MTKIKTITVSSEARGEEQLVANVLGERDTSPLTHALLDREGTLVAVCGGGIIGERGHSGWRRTSPLRETRGEPKEATCRRCMAGLERRGV